MATSSQDISEELQEYVTRILQPKKVEFMKRVRLTTKCKSEEKILALTLWRAFLLPVRLSAKVEISFNYLEINAINAVDHTQVVIETEKLSHHLKLMSFEDLEQVVSHVTASLKKIFPDSSPGKLLKKNSPELQERIKKITSALDEQTNANQGPCGGYSETYAALCDYNGFPFKEEIQWDVDTIYHSQNTKEFNLLDFSHLDARDVALSVAALAFNQWFTKLFSKDLRLSPDVIEQVLYVISLSSKLEELVLENAGMKFDAGQKIALALEENFNPVLHTVNLSNNQLEDRGVSALSQQFEKLSKGLKYLNLSRTSLTTKGLNSLAQSFIANETFASSLVHLDLSGNPGILAAENTCNFYNFISHPNALAHLDLAGTDCALDSLFEALNRGCCTHLTSLILNRNVFSHKKIREVPLSLKQFFSNCSSLKFITLSGIKLPLEGVRAILQGLAYNAHICDVHLDLSNCELRSAGAQVIQDHIIDANSISSLDLSDNGFDSDMVTLVLSIGRSKSIRHVALGKNFNIKSKALADVLHRIVQLIQDEECPLRSLSVADSRLKSGTNVLINALGSNTCLKKIDISGNAMGDTGAKMLAKALQINTSLGTVIWDRNNTAAVGFMDVANALERNYTLRSMPLPMSDISQAYRSNPEKTEEALQKIQSYLLRNNQMKKSSPEQAFRLQERIVTTSTQQMVDSMCERVQENLNIISNESVKERQEDVAFAEETIKEAKMLTTMLPTLYQMGNTPPLLRTVQHKLESAAEEVSQAVEEEIQTLIQSLMKSTSILCPHVLQKVNIQEQITNKVFDKLVIPKDFTRSVIVEQAGLEIVNKLSEVKLNVTAALIDHFVDHILKDLTIAQQKLASHASKPPSETLSSDKANAESSKDETTTSEAKDSLDKPDNNLAPIESVTMLRRKTIHSRRIRPTTAMNRISDIEMERQADETDSAVVEQMLTVSSCSVKFCLASADMSGAETTFTDTVTDLPTEGMKLSHCTRSRPRPNRTRKQPPSKPNVQPVEQEKGEDATESKLDLGLEEFFTKKIVQEESIYVPAALDDSLSRKGQTPKQEDPSTSTLTLPKTKKRYPKLSDLFVFKKTRFNKIQKAERDPEGNQQKGKKSLSMDIMKFQNRSEEMHGHARPQEGSAEQAKQESTLRHQSSSRGIKARSLILFPGSKDAEELSMQFAVRGKEPNSELCEGSQLLRSEQNIHRALDRAGLKVLYSDPKMKLGAESEVDGTNSNGMPGENKPQPPPQSLKLSALANMAKTCAGSNADKEENSEGPLSTGVENAESDSEEETKRQEVTSGGVQRILLPPPRRKNLQHGSKEQSSNPVPVPRKLIALQKGIIQDEAPSSEKHTPTNITSMIKPDNEAEDNKKNEECSPSKDINHQEKPLTQMKVLSVSEAQLDQMSSPVQPEADLKTPLPRKARTLVRARGQMETSRTKECHRSEDECEIHTAELLSPMISEDTEETTAI
ncbi:LOW QUALITY PROTEIN: capping protein, Arp2/3 and myosin-I linker protein 2 [Scyliorhinus canicula]|uniref:LOW QUALITY PROTEIN: capping protein, Arp2/3 and myosin-I linker protein 2 n=1 Tax=Scyliorhinus canicula TaxID=7830 RepID=UPI0018F478EE|nr:LOW QUALITY PROTEIN: capping protein, Arp2/3 and myosin-I linker protein 2 [Scyliorhinus canicula]